MNPILVSIGITAAGALLNGCWSALNVRMENRLMAYMADKFVGSKMCEVRHEDLEQRLVRIESMGHYPCDQCGRMQASCD